MMFLPSTRAAMIAAGGVHIRTFDRGGASQHIDAFRYGGGPPLEPPIAVMTRPQDWAEPARRILFGRTELR